MIRKAKTARTRRYFRGYTRTIYESIKAHIRT